MLILTAAVAVVFSLFAGYAGLAGMPEQSRRGGLRTDIYAVCADPEQGKRADKIFRRADYRGQMRKFSSQRQSPVTGKNTPTAFWRPWAFLY